MDRPEGSEGGIQADHWTSDHYSAGSADLGDCRFGVTGPQLDRGGELARQESAVSQAGGVERRAVDPRLLRSGAINPDLASGSPAIDALRSTR